MQSSEPTILVTGGAGYIGSHVCRALKIAGFHPVSFDNLIYGHRNFVKWGPLVVGDIRDSQLISSVIREHDVKAVMHFAAFAYVGESISEPLKYYDNNVCGTLGLLKGMRQAHCDVMVFSSSCAVYGQPSIVPIDETCFPAPINPYGRSKLMCEQIFTDFRSAYGLRCTALRYFNASGSAPGSGLGELRDIETHLIPRAMMAIQGHIDDFEVFGNDFTTEDGTAVRDYIHVMDLANAHISALKKLLGGAEGGTFNLGAGSGYSVAQVLDCIADVTGQRLSAPRGSRRSGDPACLVADATRAKMEIEFSPVYSTLKNIVETAWVWHSVAHPQRSTECTQANGER